MADKQVSPILLGQTDNTNVMRGRDVRHLLQREGLSPALMSVLERIAEINHVNMKAIAELATMMDQTVNMIQSFGEVAENMKKRTDQMARAMVEGQEDEPTTTSH